MTYEEKRDAYLAHLKVCIYCQYSEKRWNYATVYRLCKEAVTILESLIK